MNMSEVANFLAVDLGASNGRVVWGRWDGRKFELQELYRFPNNPLRQAGYLKWDVERLWQEIKHGLTQYKSVCSEPLTSIGVDTWAVDFVLLDADGRLLDLPYHYRDQRTDGMLEEVLQRLPKARIFAETGLQFLPFNTLYQLYSQARHAPADLERAATLLMIPDFFNYRLCGRKVVEYTNATTTQFFSVKQPGWATGLLADLNIPTHFLPPVVLPGTLLGELLPEIAREVGLEQTSPVVIIAPGTHDTASAVAGIALLDPKTAFLSSGTWSLMGVELDQPILSPAALAMNFTNEGGVEGTFRLLKNVMGLWLIQECQRNWQEAGLVYSWPELVEMSRQSPAFVSLIDPDALDFLSPPNMVEAIQHYCQRTGQSVPESPGQLIRCCLESLALKYCLVLEQLEQLLGYRLNIIRTVGGGSQNELLCRFTAEACQREVISGPVEATALGNIMLQAIATGHLSSLAEGRRFLENNVTLKHYPAPPTNSWEKVFTRFKQLIEGR